MKDEVIAIDGPAASGKSTIASKVADKLGIPYISTGNMYRTITYFVLNKKLDVNTISDDNVQPLLDEMDLQYKKDESGDFVIYLNGKIMTSEIRTPEVANAVSIIAMIPKVRHWLVEKQRAMRELGLILMEGRDIGTEVFPNAKYKFFLTASPEVRAIRRLNQAGESAEGATVESVAAEIRERDERDMNRPISPLIQADDAILADSSDMTIQEVLDFITSKI